MQMTWLPPVAACVALAGFIVVAGKFDTDAPVEPELIAGASAAPTELVQPRYQEGAKACLAEAIYFETKGTSPKAAQAVAHVVLNRREHEEFPQSVCAVVDDGCQFSYQCDGKPERMADAVEHRRALRAAETVLDEQSTDPTEGALYFHAESAPAGWFETLDRTVEIGGNIFYR